jgi:4-diphosphocytidyl-2-C-methyl-D-erythritol kinase
MSTQSFEKKDLVLFSPAKLNLFFKVLKKRDDGYHEIASLYQTISLGDIIRLRLSKEDEFISKGSNLLWDKNNLIYKAVFLYRKKTGFFFPVSIFLEKNIPMQSGLGGGSANAATILYGLNQLSDKKVSEEDLIAWSSELGSDVSFFFSNGRAYCTGVGEKFWDVSYPSPFSGFLAIPNFGMATEKVYNSVKISLLEKTDPKILLQSFTGKNPFFHNDLELPAFSLEPKLKEIKGNLINMGFDNVVMTGSGSSFICIGNQKPKELIGVKFIPITSIVRRNDLWYSC